MDLHPATVHFPIALLVASFIFDLVGVVSKDDSFRRAGLYCLILGLLGTGGAYWTGVMAESEARHIPHIGDALEAHRLAGITTILFAGMMVLGRIVLEGRPLLRRVGYVVYLLVALIAVVNVLRTGYLGAELVQRFGAGVEPVVRQLEIRRSQPAVPSPVPPPVPAGTDEGTGPKPSPDR